MNLRLSILAASAFALAGTAALAQSTTSTTTVATDRTGAVQAVGVASTTSSGPVANPPPSTTPPTTVADPGYSGNLQGAAFRDVDARIAAVAPKVKGKAAMSLLNNIKGEERMRRARHGGELRDWDRELLNKKLDQLEGMVGG